MPVEVACPNCKRLLKAPDEAAGKKARCKRCRASFYLPGTPSANSDESSVQLSAEGVLPPSAPAADANPFAFDDTPAVGMQRPTPLAQPSVSASKEMETEPVQFEATVSDNPFAFSTPDTPAADDAQPKSQRSKPVQKARTETSRKPVARKPARASGTLRIIGVAGVVGLFCAIGGGIGVYLWMQMQNPVASGPVPADSKPIGSVDQPEGNRLAPPADKADASDVSRPSSPRVVRITGGLELPAGPNTGGTVIQKPNDRLSLDIEAGKIQRVLFADTEAAVAAVVWPSFAGVLGRGGTNAVDVYSLNSGNRIDRLELPASGRGGPLLCSLSPDGNRFAAESPASRLTVWNLIDKLKLIDGVEPFAADGETAPGIAAVYFVDNDRLAVVSPMGAVDVWSLKANAKIASGPPLGKITQDRPLLDQRTITITPDRKAVLLMVGEQLYEVPLKTSLPAAALTLPRKPESGYALAADSSGSRVLAAYRASDPGPHTLIVVARLGSEKPTMMLHLAESAGEPVAAAWPALDTAVVLTDKGVALVIDAEVNRVIAAIRPAAAPALLQPGVASERFWYALPDPADVKQSLLLSIPMPFDDYFSLRDAANEPIGLAISAEGLGK